MTFTTRFAPSPTGPLHLGHAYSALLAHDMARAQNGRFLLRIEDIDQTRARPHWEDQIYEDLQWLGITWDAAPMRQSDRLDAYKQALVHLWHRDLLYPCSCNRRDIAAALNAPQEGDPPLTGPDGLIYPGTCRTTAPAPSVTDLPNGALRLHMDRATRRPLSFTETGDGAPVQGRIDIETPVQTIGDILLSRKDFFGSYHLSVVLDDAAQNITHVIRGADLFDATSIHVILQDLLGLPTPTYHHHRLIRDAQGKRLAKRDDARAIAKFRAEGATPDDIRKMVGLD